MKKYLIGLILIIFGNVAFASTVITSNNDQHQRDEANSFAAIQSSPVLPTNAAWLIIKKSRQLVFFNGAITYCKDAPTLFGNECESGLKRMSVNQYVKTLVPKAKILGMTPHFDKDANFVFMTVYYIIEE